MHILYISLFAAVSAIPSSQYEIVFPEVETSRSGVKTVKFRSLDQDNEFILEPAGQILGKKFGFLGENGQVYHPVDVNNLRSKLYRNSAKGAALIIDEDGPLTIEGIVYEKLRIASHESGRMDEDGRLAHQIVEEINEEKSTLHYDVSPMNIESEVERKVESIKGMARDNQCIVIEFLSVTDKYLTEDFQTEEALTKHMTATYMGVQNRIDTLDLGIKVSLIGIQAFTNETEPPFIEESAIPDHELFLNYVKLIKNMENYYFRHYKGLAKDADIIMLHVYRHLAAITPEGNLNIRIGGGANMGTVCNSRYKVGVIFHSSDFNTRVGAIAHETAHLIGVPHDGESNGSRNPGAKNCSFQDGYLMGNLLGRNNKKFSECSKACAKYTLSLPEANCVYEDCEIDENN